MNRMRDRGIVIVAALILAVVLIGEVYIYTFNADATYSVDSEITSDSFTYKVHSNISNCYDVVLSDNGSSAPLRGYYLYYDSTYASNLKDVDQPIGSTKLDQEYYVSQLRYQLSNRGVEVTTVNAEELGKAIANDISGNTCGKGLICVSGALPDTVYIGNSSDPILTWIKNGGCLYWVGGLIGSCYSTTDGIVNVTADYQSMFLMSSDCLNTGNTDKAYSEITVNDYKSALSLSGNSVKYGVNTYALTTGYLAVGFFEEEYSSITFVKNGNGTVCVVAGDYSNAQRADLAQVIAAHLCSESKIIIHESGSVTRGTATGTSPVSSATGYRSAYIYLGGYFLEYGRCTDYLGTERL